MTSAPPADPQLPNFPTLFDGEAMRALIAYAAGEDRAAEIVACRPRYVRYKPRTSCLVAYELELQSGGRCTTCSAHVRSFADDRARQRMGRKRLTRLLARVEETCDAMPIGPVDFLPEVNGIVSVYPVDYELRSLVEVASASSAQRTLGGLPGVAEPWLVSDPELIRYKPGRKALFRYVTTNGVVYGKTHAENRATAIGTATQALIGAGLHTPRVLGIDERLAFIAHEAAPGSPLAALRGEPRYGHLVGSLAEPLALLHRTRIEGLPVRRLGDEVDGLRETGAFLGAILPAAQPRLDRIVGLLENRLARIDDELAIGHGDFYDDQAIVGDDGIALIDLDEIRIAHPMLDVGNMLAHLNFDETRGLVGRDAREAFITGMRERRNMDERDIAVFEAAGLLKLAPGPFRRLEPNWRAGVADILDLTAQALDRAASPRSPVALAIDPDAAPVRDDALPELLALQDPMPMQRALRAATGNSALMLAGIRLQRHKPGRRAVLRYDMVGDDAIWGKIFASNRGTRVHEIARAICAARAFGPDVALPDPIAFLPELRVLLQRSAPGEAIDARLCAGDERLVDAIAVAIHALHASGLDLGRVHDLASELAPLGPRVREVGACHPWLENSARELHARVLAAAGSLRGWRRVAIHRDFYHGQALVDGERLAILDLDDAAMSEPAVDIANFAAHLDLLALQRPDHAGDIARVRDRFLARSRELDPDLDGSMLAVLTAGTVLRLAGIHAPREDGARIAAGLLARGARVASTAAA